MPYIVWSEMFSVGVPELDAQHQHLFQLVNAFHEAWEEGSENKKLFELMNALVKYAEDHFDTEKRRMESCRYPKTLQHHLEHEGFLKRVFEFNEKFERGEDAIPDRVIQFLEEWLLKHVLTVDKEYKPYLQSPSGI